ncbi:hypothetical protein ACQB60_35025 [Actinomycetota bacterium Odt1-20B]
MQTRWWKGEKTAEGKYVRWIGESNGIDGARVELAECDGDASQWMALTSCPDEET